MVCISHVVLPLHLHTPVHTMYTTDLHESPVRIRPSLSISFRFLTFNALKDLYVLHAPELFTSPISRSIDW